MNHVGNGPTPIPPLWTFVVTLLAWLAVVVLFLYAVGIV